MPNQEQGDRARPTGGYPAVPPGTGHYPAAPGGSPESTRLPAIGGPVTGGYAAVPAAPPTGRYTGSPSTGGRPAVPPPSTGGYPAVPPPTGHYGAVAPPPTTGRHVAVVPPSGARDAVAPLRPEGRQSAKVVGEEAGRFGRFPRVGERVDAYAVRQLLGQGNMGKIYRVRDTLGRNLAMKVILAEIANKEGLLRFEREGQALASIPRHRNVVAVHSTGQIRGMPYMIMDFVDGRSLESFLKDGPLPVKQAGVVGEKVGKALEHCHSAGVLHRDLKPANILIHSETGEPVLTDFGLAGMTGAESLTQTGDLLGTPLYMSPEQVLGLNKDVDGRADVWGLGVLLYEMITGTVPFPGQTMVEVCEGITGRDPTPLNQLCPDADHAITGIVGKALAKKKGDRYQSPVEVSRALRAWRKAIKAGETPVAPPPPPQTRRKSVLVVGAVAALVMVSMGAAVAMRLRSTRQAGSDHTRESPAAGGDTKSAAVDPDALQEMLAEVSEAVDGDDLDEAYQVLDRADRQGLKGHPEVAALRARVLKIGETLLSGNAPQKRLNSMFMLAGMLNLLTPDAADPAFADAVVDRALRLDKDSPTRLGNPRAVDLVKRLARAGLRPRPFKLLNLLDEQIYLGKTRPPSPDFNRRYYELLLAAVQLEVGVSNEQLAMFEWWAWTGRPKSSSGAQETLLLAMLDCAAARRRGDQRALRGIYERFERLTDVGTDRLGARNRARVLTYTLRLGGAGVANRDERLEEARRLAPLEPDVRLLVAEDCWEQVERGSPADAERLRAVIEEGCALAAEGLAGTDALFYDLVPSKADPSYRMRQRAVQLFSVAGRDSEARAVIDRLERLPGNRAGQASECKQLARDAQKVRERLFSAEAGNEERRSEF